jgi:hypothetical protein
VLFCRHWLTCQHLIATALHLRLISSISSSWHWTTVHLGDLLHCGHGRYSLTHSLPCVCIYFWPRETRWFLISPKNHSGRACRSLILEFYIPYFSTSSFSLLLLVSSFSSYLGSGLLSSTREARFCNLSYFSTYSLVIFFSFISWQARREESV